MEINIDWKKLNAGELKELNRRMGLSTEGNKTSLISTIDEYTKSNQIIHIPLYKDVKPPEVLPESNNDQPKVIISQQPCIQSLRHHLLSCRITALLRIQHKIMMCIKKYAQEVYQELGWGHTELHYQEALTFELMKKGYYVKCETVQPVIYKGQPLGGGGNHRIDIIVTHPKSKTNIILELKAVSGMETSSWREKAIRQCRIYLHNNSNCDTGMVINFPQRPHIHNICCIQVHT